MGYLIDGAPSLLGAALLSVAYGLWLAALLRDGDAEIPTPEVRMMVILAGAGAALWLAGLGWTIANRWVRAGRTGQSAGRRLMRTALVGQETRRPIGPLNAFIRDLLHILDALAYVGFLWPLWDERRQTFADLLMRTVVIDLRSP